MTKISISVVLCTYNGAQFLGEQLDSLLRQGRLPDEIIVGDDDSADESWDLVQSFAARAEALGVRVRLNRHAVNVGYVKNFATTLSLARGDVLFLCDQDDVWWPDKLAIMEARFAADPKLLLLCTDARLVGAQGLPLGRTLFDALALSHAQLDAVHDGHAFEDVLLHRTMATGATMAIRRQLLEFALPIGAGWIHDEWLAITAATLGRVDVLEQPLIDYRQHGANQVGVPLRRRTWREKWNGLWLPRGVLLRGEIDRLGAVAERLRDLSDQPGRDTVRLDGYLRLVEDRLGYFSRRIELGRLPCLQRLAPIWREALAGTYQHYGTGVRSMLRDLLRRG